MNFAPFGVFALMIDVVASAGVEALLSLGKYMFVVLLGLITHSFVLVFYGAAKMKKVTFVCFLGEWEPQYLRLSQSPHQQRLFQ